MADRSFEGQNAATRERLARLAGSVTSAELDVDLGDGWTVASAFAHLAFWDRWQEARLRRVLAGSWQFDHRSVLEAEDLANEAIEALLERMAPAAPAKLAVDSAERLDATVAAVPDDVADSLLGTPADYVLHRHRHRAEHLDQIERGIAAAASAGDRSFADRNAASRARLAAVVARLAPADLALATGPGDEGSWTVAQTLGHILFWDRSWEARWRAALEVAGESGTVDLVGIPLEAVDAINVPFAGLIEGWTAALGEAMGAEAVAAAGSLDGLIEANAHRLPPAAPATRPAWVHRWRHRISHLEAVEKAIAGSPR